jgi:hypothetical protein
MESWSIAQALIAIVLVVLVMTVGMAVAVAVIVIITIVALLAAFPVAFVITVTVLTVLPPCWAPGSASIGWTHPASRAPDISRTTGSPVAVYPDIIHLWWWRRYLIAYRRRRCADRDPN